MKQPISMLDAYGRGRGLLPPALCSSIQRPSPVVTTPANSLAMATVAPCVQPTPPETPIPGISPPALSPGGHQLSTTSGTHQAEAHQEPSLLPLLLLGGVVLWFFRKGM